MASMNELPLTGSLCLRTDFWDHHGAKIATHYKEMYGEMLFRRPNKTIWERDYRFFAAFLSEMDLGNANSREA